MRLALIAAAALTLSAGAVPAGAAFASQPGADAERATSRVFVCDRSAVSTQSWIRECAAHAASPDNERATSAAFEPASRQVFVCDRSAATRRSWMRQYGEMTFVTADELAQAEASNEGWPTPRCMTSAEARRFTKGRPEAAAVARAVNASPGF